MSAKNINFTCPHCGAERREYGLSKYYECWTQINAPSIRDVDCYKRQLAAKDEELDVLNIKNTLLEDEVKRLMQLFTDPENQPTQYGTVSLDYMEREIAKEREACAEVCKRLSKGRGCFVEEVLNEAVEAIRARGEK